MTTLRYNLTGDGQGYVRHTHLNNDVIVIVLVIVIVIVIVIVMCDTGIGFVFQSGWSLRHIWVIHQQDHQCLGYEHRKSHHITHQQR